MKYLKDANIKDKRVIIRCDFNVPIDNGKIMDDNRLLQSLPTIKYVYDRAKKVIILSHLGRVNNDTDIKNNTLKPVCDYLSSMLNINIAFCTYSDDINSLVNENKIVMFENTRYFDLDNKKESNNDMLLAKYFSSFADIFINDAFGVCHRTASSTVGISKFLPSYAGLLIEKEIKYLDIIRDNPKKPFTIILGGSKISDKIGIITNLIDKVDKFVIVGAMAFTFLKSLGKNVGNSIVDEENIEYARNLYNKYSNKIILPIDIYTSKELSDISKKELKNVDDIKDGDIGLDIGPKTIDLIYNNILDSKTIFLNGPAGAFEYSNYEYGTKEILNIISKIDACVIIGGGDSSYAAIKFGYKDKFDHISTGGGASLEYLEGKDLPGIKCLCG